MTLKASFPSMCDWCKHHQGIQNNRVVCDAFPDGIPMEILDSRVSHRQPYPDDNGIQFDKQEDETLWSDYLKTIMEKSPYDADTLFQMVIDLTESTEPVNLRKYPMNRLTSLSPENQKIWVYLQNKFDKKD